MRILIETVPHSQQRYNTVGDYTTEPDGTLHVRVSQFGPSDWKFAFLIALHEIVEAMLCKDRGVTHRDIDAFDMAFTPSDLNQEPGDDMMAPYWREHQFATGIERLMAAEMGVNWLEYERQIDVLSESRGD